MLGVVSHPFPLCEVAIPSTMNITTSWVILHNWRDLYAEIAPSKDNALKIKCMSLFAEHTKMNEFFEVLSHRSYADQIAKLKKVRDYHQGQLQLGTLTETAELHALTPQGTAIEKRKALKAPPGAPGQLKLAIANNVSGGGAAA